MQLIIEIPDHLAAKVPAERERLVEIIERGMRQQWSETAGLAREIIAFLAKGPHPTEIMTFKPSEFFLEHTRELINRSKEGTANSADEAELDEIAYLDHFVSLIKAEARQHLRAA